MGSTVIAPKYRLLKRIWITPNLQHQPFSSKIEIHKIKNNIRLVPNHTHEVRVHPRGPVKGGQRRRDANSAALSSWYEARKCMGKGDNKTVMTATIKGIGVERVHF